MAAGAFEPEVMVEDDGPVRVITLNRPHRLNAFTDVGYRQSPPSREPPGWKARPVTSGASMSAPAQVGDEVIDEQFFIDGAAVGR
jgi:hypothetical protein